MIRIAAEFIRGFRRLHFVGPCVTIFGSARFKEDNPWYIMARRTAEELGRQGFTIMTGGGLHDAGAAARDDDVIPLVVALVVDRHQPRELAGGVVVAAVGEQPLGPLELPGELRVGGLGRPRDRPSRLGEPPKTMTVEVMLSAWKASSGLPSSSSIRTPRISGRSRSERSSCARQ